MKTPSSLVGPLFVLISSLCFSTSGFLQAIAPEGASPCVTAFFRMAIGAAALLLWLLFRGHKPSLSNWPVRYVLTYAFCLWTFQVFYFSSVLVVGVAIAAVVSIGVTPIFAGIVTWFLKGTRPGLAWYPATAAAVAGLFLINPVGEAASFDPVYLIFPVIAGASYGVNISVAHKLTEKHPPEEAMMLVSGLAALGLLPFLIADPVAWVATPRGAAVVLALGLVTAALGFALLATGLRTTPAPLASTLALGEPLGAAALGIIVLGEPCTARTLLGMALMLGAILALTLAEAVKKEPVKG